MIEAWTFGPFGSGSNETYWIIDTAKEVYKQEGTNGEIKVPAYNKFDFQGKHGYSLWTPIYPDGDTTVRLDVTYSTNNNDATVKFFHYHTYQ